MMGGRSRGSCLCCCLLGFSLKFSVLRKWGCFGAARGEGSCPAQLSFPLGSRPGTAGGCDHVIGLSECREMGPFSLFSRRKTEPKLRLSSRQQDPEYVT